MTVDIQKEASTSSNDQINNYKNFLNQISEKSLDNFQNATKKFEVELETQMQEFRKVTLANLQKELEEYKQQRFKVADKKINEIIQRASQKVFNKSISLEDHKILILDSLEKSRKKGVFD